MVGGVKGISRIQDGQLEVERFMQTPKSKTALKAKLSIIF